MKKIIFILFAGVLVLAACTGVKSLSSGLESEAYLKFIGNTKLYENGVEVTVDDKIVFTAQVVDDAKKEPAGNVYAIAPGKHTVNVKYNDNVIYSKLIFISTQETKKVILP